MADELVQRTDEQGTWVLLTDDVKVINLADIREKLKADPRTGRLTITNGGASAVTVPVTKNFTEKLIAWREGNG